MGVIGAHEDAAQRRLSLAVKPTHIVVQRGGKHVGKAKGPVGILRVVVVADGLGEPAAEKRKA